MSVSAADVALLNERVKGVVYDNTVRDSALLAWAKKKGRIKHNCGGHPGIEFYVKYRDDGAPVKAINIYAEVGATTMDNEKKLVSLWASYAHGLATSKLLEARTKNTKDADTNFDWLLAQLNNFIQKFQVRIVNDMWRGTGVADANYQDSGNTLIGLYEWIDNNNVVLDQNRAIASGEWFRSFVDTVADPMGTDYNNGDPNLFIAMRNAWSQATTGKQTGNMINKILPELQQSPDLTVSDRATYNLYQSNLQQFQRFINEDADPTFRTLTFEGYPYAWDQYASAGKIVMLPTSQWHFCTVEGDQSFSSLYAEDNTNMVSKVVYGGQLTQYLSRPNNCARLDVTLPS